MNQTPVSALLWRSSLENDRMAAALIARITYRIADGQLVMDREQPWVVSSVPWESPAGTMNPDDCFRRGGVDLLVLGCARALGGRSSRKIEVRVTLGDFVSGVDVYGERVWTEGLGRTLVPTVPVPFVERPLTLAFAYGGKQLWDQLEVPFPANPQGKGWYYDETSAVGRPLPNIEDPKRPLQRVADQPDPVGVGLCPMGFGPLLQRSVKLDPRGMLEKMHATFYNEAFPDMIAPFPAEGALCTVSGVHPDGPVAFRVPASPLVTDIRIGATQVERPLAVDQIGIEPDLGRVFISYRFPFRYTIVRMQRRACILRWSTRALEAEGRRMDS